MTDVKLTDIKLEDKILYRLKINCITMQFAILFKTTAERKSQQQSKLHNMHMYNNYVEMHKILRKHPSKISYR